VSALRPLLALVVAVAVPAVVAIALVEGTRGPDRIALVAGASGHSAADRVAVDAAAPAGDWRELPPAPLDPRWGAFSVWTGDDLLVWGGYAWPSERGDEGPRADGAAFDGRRWAALPDGPLRPVMRHGGVAAWTGEELLIAGGTGGDEGRTPVRAAAAYDPRDAAWRTLPKLPGPIVGGGWVGSRLVVIGEAKGARRAVYALKPDDARWRRLDPLPLPAGDDGDVHVQATDRHLLAVAQGEAWLFTPGDGWERLPAPAAGVTFDEVTGLARDGGALVVLLPGDTYRYRPHHGRWSRVGGGPEPGPVQPVPVLHSERGDLVAVDLPAARVHTMAGGAWVAGPRIPADRVDATAQIVGDQIVIWGGMGSEERDAAQGWTLPLAAASSPR